MENKDIIIQNKFRNIFLKIIIYNLILIIVTLIGLLIQQRLYLNLDLIEQIPEFNAFLLKWINLGFKYWYVIPLLILTLLGPTIKGYNWLKNRVFGDFYDIDPVKKDIKLQKIEKNIKIIGRIIMVCYIIYFILFFSIVVLQPILQIYMGRFLFDAYVEIFKLNGLFF